MSTRPASPHKLPASSELKGKRIAIYGLSANPPTIAHRNIIAHLCSQRLFDEIWVLPVYQHIFDSKRGLESYEHRVAMCEISLTDTTGTGRYAQENDTLVRISKLEKIVYNANQMPVNTPMSIDINGSNSSTKSTSDSMKSEHSSSQKKTRIGTVDILEYVNALYSEDIEWNLILGTDTYRDLVGGKWKRADDIVRIAKLHVFCRENPYEMKLVSAPSNAKVTMYQIPGLEDISSTNIRNKISPIIFGSFASIFSETAYTRDIVESSYVDWVHEGGVHPGVLAYIKSRQLYFMSPENLIKRRRWFIIMIINLVTAVVCIRNSNSSN